MGHKDRQQLCGLDSVRRAMTRNEQGSIITTCAMKILMVSDELYATHVAKPQMVKPKTKPAAYMPSAEMLSSAPHSHFLTWISPASLPIVLEEIEPFP
jgi:hypothetical protein